MTQPSKTGRMISALDLANRIVADAERYHTGMGVLPFITMSSGARKILEEDPETRGWFYVESGCLGFHGYFVITDPSDKVWYQIGRRQFFEEED